MPLLIFVIFEALSLVLCNRVTIQTMQVENGTCDTYKNNYFNENKVVEVIYEGGRVPLECKFGLLAHELIEIVTPTYQICVTPYRTRIDDCRLKLNYYFGLQDFSPTVRYTCEDTISEFCQTSRNIVIEIKVESEVSSLNASVYLTVKATKVTTPPDQSLLTFIGVICGLVFIGFLVLVICMCK